MRLNLSRNGIIVAKSTTEPDKRSNDRMQYLAAMFDSSCVLGAGKDDIKIDHDDSELILMCQETFHGHIVLNARTFKFDWVPKDVYDILKRITPFAVEKRSRSIILLSNLNKHNNSLISMMHKRNSYCNIVSCLSTNK